MMQHITLVELKQKLATGFAPVLVDVRERWEFDICHIEDALLIPLHSLADTYQTLDNSRPIVLICHHGIRSQQAAYFLDSAGFEVINLTGGIDAWAHDVDPSMPSY